MLGKNWWGRGGKFSKFSWGFSCSSVFFCCLVSLHPHPFGRFITVHLNLISDFFGVVVVLLFSFVVVGCCFCWNCLKNCLIDFMLVACYCLLVLLVCFLFFVVDLIVFFRSGGGFRFICLLVVVFCCFVTPTVVVSSWFGLVYLFGFVVVGLVRVWGCGWGWLVGFLVGWFGNAG